MKTVLLAIFFSVALIGCNSPSDRKSTNDDSPAQENPHDSNTGGPQRTDPEKTGQQGDEPEQPEEKDPDQTAGGWSKEHKQAFMTRCLEFAKVNGLGDRSQASCTCILGKLQSKYPSPSSIDSSYIEELTALALGCD